MPVLDASPTPLRHDEALPTAHRPLQCRESPPRHIEISRFMAMMATRATARRADGDDGDTGDEDERTRRRSTAWTRNVLMTMSHSN